MRVQVILLLRRQPALALQGGNALWTCTADASTAAAGYDVVRIEVENFASRPFPVNYASGNANNPEAPMILAGQIAIWVPETEVLEEIVDLTNVSGTTADFFNSISAEDGNTQVTASDGPGGPIEPVVQGTSGPNAAGASENNSSPGTLGEAPTISTPGNSVIGHDIHWAQGPFKLRELISDSGGRDPQPRVDYDRRNTSVGGAGGQQPGGNIAQHADEDGNDLIGRTPRGATVVLNASVTTINQSDDNGSNSFLHGCTAFDTTHYELIPMPTAIPVSRVADNTFFNVSSPTLSQTSVAPNSGPLAHAIYGHITNGILDDPDVDVIMEFTNAPLSRPVVATRPGGVAPAADTFGVDNDGVTCNESDAGPAGWVSATADPAVLAATFDLDSNGTFEGITRARYRTTERVEWGNYAGFGPNAFNNRLSGIQAYFQALVKADDTVQVVNSELFALQSHAFGDFVAPVGDPTDLVPNSELFPGQAPALADCRPFNDGEWALAGANDVNTTTGWCSNLFVDDGDSSLDATDSIDWDNRAATDFFDDAVFDASGAVISIVEAGLIVTKANRDGINDIVDNGQTVEFILTPRVVGSNQEALTNVRFIDNLDSRFEFGSFTVLPSTPGATCSHNGVNPGGQIFCRFSAFNPANPGSFAAGLPGGWNDEIRFEVTVVGAIADQDSRTVLPNRVSAFSSGIGPWAPAPVAGNDFAGAFTLDPLTGGISITDSGKSSASSANAFMPLPADEAVIAKVLPAQQGICDVVQQHSQVRLLNGKSVVS